MSISPSLVNDILSRSRFDLRKGDAAKVAANAASESEIEIVAVAERLGVRKRVSPGSYLGFELGPGDEDVMRSAVELIAKLASEVIDEELVDWCVGEIIDEAVDAKEPCDLSKFETIADYLDECLDERMSCLMEDSETSRTDWDEVFGRVETDAIMRAVDAARKTAPEPIRSFLARLEEDVLNLFALKEIPEELSAMEAGRDWLEFEVDEVSFREALLARRPDAAERLKRDEERAVLASQVEDMAMSRVGEVAAAIKRKFASVKIGPDDACKVANEIVRYVRDEEGLILANALFSNEKLLSVFTKAGRKKFKSMFRDWDELMASGALDFGSPLFKLFCSLDDTWAVDGRKFFVSVTQFYNEETSASKSASFGGDNWMFFAQFALVGGIKGLSHRYGIVVRRFEPLVKGQKIPAKTIGGLAIWEDQVGVCTDDEIKNVSNRHPRTGEPLEPEPMATFAAMEEICPSFLRAINQETPKDGNFGFG